MIRQQPSSSQQFSIVSTHSSAQEITDEANQTTNSIKKENSFQQNEPCFVSTFLLIRGPVQTR